MDALQETHRLIDLRAPCAPGSLSRSILIERAGLFRIARRDAELYSVIVAGPGIWGRLSIRDQEGKPLFIMPSTFTGSFWVSAGARAGIIVELHNNCPTPNFSLTLNWRERDQRMV